MSVKISRRERRSAAAAAALVYLAFTLGPLIFVVIMMILSQHADSVGR